jgi:hypothetical protein
VGPLSARQLLYLGTICNSFWTISSCLLPLVWQTDQPGFALNTNLSPAQLSDTFVTPFPEGVTPVGYWTSSTVLVVESTSLWVLSGATTTFRELSGIRRSSFSFPCTATTPALTGNSKLLLDCASANLQSCTDLLGLLLTSMRHRYLNILHKPGS